MSTTLTAGGDILARILEHKREEVAESRRRLPLQEITGRLGDLSLVPPAQGRNFAAALKTGQVALVAEVKRRSPSRGVIKEDFDPVEVVKAYRDAGVAAVSVLTDRQFFGGAPEYLAMAKRVTGLPLLRKDFIISEYQIYEARLLGADAVLLLAGVLTGTELGEFIGLARQLGMEALVETRSPAEISRAVESGAAVIGINNRDLHTFRVDLGITGELIKYIDDPGIAVVSESGIKTRDDVQRLAACGVDAVLVGETLMISGDLRRAAAGLMGVAVSPRGEPGQNTLKGCREVSGV